VKSAPGSAASERRGLWSALSDPRLYDAFQTLIGTRRWLRKFARNTIRARSGDRLLDIGCGPGALLRYLPATSYIGFDRSESYIQRARLQFGSLGTFICDDVRHFSQYKFEQVDIAVAIGLLHHIDDEVALEMFRAIAAILKPDGRLVTADPCFHADQTALQRLVVKSDRGAHVRPYGRYLELCQSVFPDAQAKFQSGYLPFPYSVCVMLTRADEAIG
jgi:SAM-dependent methyltransferase